MNKIFSKFLTITKYYVLVLGFISIPFQVMILNNQDYIQDGYINISNVMDSDRCKDVYDQAVCDKELEPGYYFFSQDDVSKVEQIDGVESVDISYSNRHVKDSDNSELSVNQIVTLNLTSQDIIDENTGNFLKRVYNTHEYSYKFSSLMLPFDELSKTGMINESYQATRLIGELRENDGDNQSVIIPEHLALYYNVSQGDTVTLPVTVLTQDGYIDQDMDYFVAGIYDESGLPDDQKANIYVDYVDLSSYSDQSSMIYNKVSAIYKDDEAHSQYFTSGTDFTATYAPFIDQIHVFLSDDADSESVSEQLRVIFDVQQITTRESTNKAFINKVDKIIIALLLIYLIIFLGNIINVRKNQKAIKNFSPLLPIEMIVTLILIQLFEGLVVYRGYSYLYVVIPQILLVTLILTIILYLPYIIVKITNRKSND